MRINVNGTKIYAFNELSDAAKETGRAWFGFRRDDEIEKNGLCADEWFDANEYEFTADGLIYG